MKRFNRETEETRPQLVERLREIPQSRTRVTLGTRRQSQPMEPFPLHQHNPRISFPLPLVGILGVEAGGGGSAFTLKNLTVKSPNHRDQR